MNTKFDNTDNKNLTEAQRLGAVKTNTIVNKNREEAKVEEGKRTGEDANKQQYPLATLNANGESLANMATERERKINQGLGADLVQHPVSDDETVKELEGKKAPKVELSADEPGTAEMLEHSAHVADSQAQRSRAEELRRQAQDFRNWQKANNK